MSTQPVEIVALERFARHWHATLRAGERTFGVHLPDGVSSWLLDEWNEPDMLCLQSAQPELDRLAIAGARALWGQ